MKQYTKHGLMFLTKRYKSVLLKCALMNAMAAMAVFAATPAMALTPAEGQWAKAGVAELDGTTLTLMGPIEPTGINQDNFFLGK